MFVTVIDPDDVIGPPVALMPVPGVMFTLVTPPPDADASTYPLFAMSCATAGTSEIVPLVRLTDEKLPLAGKV